MNWSRYKYCKIKLFSSIIPEAYLEPSRTSTRERFPKIVNGYKPLTIFAKKSIGNVRLGSKYASVKIL